MKVEGYLFALLTIFFIPVTIIYWYLSEEVVGTVCMALTAGLTFMIGYYLLFTARRMEARPEDRPDADISEGSGEVGFFAPHSWWPIVAALGFTLFATGLVIAPFLAFIAFGVVLLATFGMLFEYYVGINRSQAHTLGALESMGERPTSPRKFLGE